MNLKILGAEMGLRGQEHLDVLAGGIEDGGEVGGSHLEVFFFGEVGKKRETTSVDGR